MAKQTAVKKNEPTPIFTAMQTAGIGAGGVATADISGLAISQIEARDEMSEYTTTLPVGEMIHANATRDDL